MVKYFTGGVSERSTCLLRPPFFELGLARGVCGKDMCPPPLSCELKSPDCGDCSLFSDGRHWTAHFPCSFDRRGALGLSLTELDALIAAQRRTFGNIKSGLSSLVIALMMRPI